MKSQMVTAVLCLALASCFAGDSLAGTDPDAFIKSYLDYEKILVDRYTKNIKSRWTVYIYEYAERLPTPDKGVKEYLASDTMSYLSISNSKLHNLYKDGIKFIVRGSSGKYELEHQYYPREFGPVVPFSHLSTQTPQTLPLQYINNDAMYDDLFGNILRKTERNRAIPLHKRKFTDYVFEIHAVTESVIDGRNAVVVYQGPGPNGPKLYFDRDNYYACLGFDSSGNAARVKYETRPGFDYPVPVKWEIWRYGKKREKLPAATIIVDSFERYTPHPDEFDIEKRFGLKPLPMPPRPDGAGAGTSSAGSGVAGRRATGLLIAAGLCALGGLIVVWRRRRRHRSRTANTFPG